MKKNQLFAMLLASIFVMGLCFASCKKDDDNKKNSLNGTTWMSKDGYGTSTLKFARETFTFEDQYGYGQEIYTGTYTYSKSIIMFYFSDGDMTTGTINGDALTLGADVYIKQ